MRVARLGRTQAFDVGVLSQAVALTPVFPTSRRLWFITFWYVENEDRGL